MLEQMQTMRGIIIRQKAEMDRMNREIVVCHILLRRKDKEIAWLEARLSKYERLAKNSGNSHTPPSKERMGDEIVRRTKTLRKPSGKKPGGQAGHENNISILKKMGVRDIDRFTCIIRNH